MDESVFDTRAIVEDILKHHGVKGMHWGVRRGKSSEKPAASEDVRKVDAHKATIKVGGTRALTNKELQEVVTRLNLEQQYSNLVSRKKNNYDKGHAAVKKILAAGKTVQEVHSFLNSPTGSIIKKSFSG